jgi:hypothetical protein
MALPALRARASIGRYMIIASYILKIGQDRVNRSKKGKVIYRQIDSVRVKPVAAGLVRQSQDPSVRRDC